LTHHLLLLLHYEWSERSPLPSLRLRSLSDERSLAKAKISEEFHLRHGSVELCHLERLGNLQRKRRRRRMDACCGLEEERVEERRTLEGSCSCSGLEELWNGSVSKIENSMATRADFLTLDQGFVLSLLLPRSMSLLLSMSLPLSLRVVQDERMWGMLPVSPQLLWDLRNSLTGRYLSNLVIFHRQRDQVQSSTTNGNSNSSNKVKDNRNSKKKKMNTNDNLLSSFPSLSSSSSSSSSSSRMSRSSLQSLLLEFVLPDLSLSLSLLSTQQSTLQYLLHTFQTISTGNNLKDLSRLKQLEALSDGEVLSPPVGITPLSWHQMISVDNYLFPFSQGFSSPSQSLV
jgi:hypothetical protein